MTVVDEDILKVVATYDMPGTTIAQNVWHVKYDGGPPISDAIALGHCFDWVEDMFLDIQGTLNESVSLNNVEASKLTSVAPAVFVSLGAIESALVGTAIGDALPHGVALVVRAGITGISALARKFIPGVNTAKVDEDEWSAGALAGAAAFLVTWLAGFDIGAGATLIAGVFSVATELFTALNNTGAVSVTPGYQRRRKPFVGI